MFALRNSRVGGIYLLYGGMLHLPVFGIVAVHPVVDQRNIFFYLQGAERKAAQFRHLFGVKPSGGFKPLEGWKLRFFSSSILLPCTEGQVGLFLRQVNDLLISKACALIQHMDLVVTHVRFYYQPFYRGV